MNSSDAWRLRNGSSTSDLRRRNQQPRATPDARRTAPRTTRSARDYRGTRTVAPRTGFRTPQTGRSYHRSSPPNRGATYRTGHSRYGYHRTVVRPHRRHYHYHDYYRRHGLSLSFSFGYGSYIGLSYYYPYRHYGYGIDFAFFYPSRVTYAYVPYGFYCDAPVVYVERVRDTYPTTEVEIVESEEPLESGEEIKPIPAAGSPTAEKFLREGSERFREGDYYEAAKQFRLAALSASDQPGPLFALGQSLVALGSDSYAARVIRRAVTLAPGLVKEPGDIVGVYPSREEFDKALDRMENLAARSGPASDAAFIVAVQRYFSGDPRAKDDFVALAELLPDDQVVALFAVSAEKRFGDAADLPEITR